MSAVPPASRLGRIPIAGILIAPLVGTTLWLSNMVRLPYEDALPVIAALFAIALAMLVGLRLLLRDWLRAGLVLLIAEVFLHYGKIAAEAVTSIAWVQALLLLLGGLVALALARRVPRERAALLNLNGKLNIIVLAIALVTVGRALTSQVSLESHRPDAQTVFPALTGKAGADSPDVWHIILDRYANSATLSDVYGYDNRPFLEALRTRGFAVRESAFSNYQRTSHSVASTLNGSYLDPLAGPMARHQDDWVPIYRAMNDNAALRFFKAQGYETIFAGSWWSPTRRSRIADRNVNFRAIPELGRLVLDQSVIGMAMSAARLPYGDGRADQCFRARAKFRSLRELARSGGRKYVFGHFLIPHPPFVLNADGSCRSLAHAEKASRRDNYVSQVRYVNSEIVALVDAILAGPRPSVIMVHADEGPWPAAIAGDERFLGKDTSPVNWTRLKEPELREKLGILMAIRAPRGSERDLPATPVNLYPTLLRNHFGGTMPDWPDRHLLYGSNQALYQFKDVTPLFRSNPASAR